MATMPQRINTCIKAIDSIYDQVDVVRLYLNNFDEVPEHFIDDKILIIQGEDLKSSGKLFNALNANEYYFCIDDDLFYPPTYIKGMIAKLNEYDDDIIVSLHGKILKKGVVRSYFKDIEQGFHCLRDVKKDVFVDVIGNGVSAWNTNKIRIDYKEFKYLYMDDICTSLQAHKQSKKRLVMAHDKGYLKDLKPDGFTLFGKYKNDDSKQTEMINTVNW